MIRLGLIRSDVRVSLGLSGWVISGYRAVSRRESPASQAPKIFPNIRKNASDFATFYSVFVKEEYRLWNLKRFAEIEAFVNNSPKCPLIIDCGANVGYTSLYFKLLFPEAKLVLIEPEFENLQSCKKLLSEFDQSDILFLQNVISASEGKFVLKDEQARPDGFTFKQANSGIEAIMLPDLIDKSTAYFEDSYPFVLKVDIEGHEAGIFENAGEHVDKFLLAFIEFHDWIYPEKRTAASGLKMLGELERNFLISGENVLSIRDKITVNKTDC